MRRFFQVVVLSLSALCIIALALLVDLSPSVEPEVNKQVENAESVSALINQLRRSLKDRYKPQKIEISLSQAESLLGFTQRAVPSIRSELKLSDGYADIHISYQLPLYFFSSYINLAIKVKEADGILVDKISIGAITIPGSWALSFAESLVNSYTNSEVATKAIKQVVKTAISADQIILKLNPMDSLLKELKNVKTSGDDNESKLLQIKTAHYLKFLSKLPHSNKANKDTSLSYYLYELMAEAKAIISEDKQENLRSATLENEAVIMALAIYAGHRRFSTVVGNLSFAVDPIPTARQKPVLANRKDLSLHFIFSAAIKLLSEQGISVAVGEFKELMDRGKGGSGFSFVDLAADMAGANFAALLVDPRTAQQMQNILSLEANEMLFFPSIKGLEEGMNKAQFKQKYSDIESEDYANVIAEIEMRLSRLPIGQLPE
ncbi:MAG: hypothetical protein ACI97K_000686 [Glaciecola sp.]|jgi:hypothetical protein